MRRLAFLLCIAGCISLGAACSGETSSSDKSPQAPAAAEPAPTPVVKEDVAAKAPPVAQQDPPAPPAEPKEPAQAPVKTVRKKGHNFIDEATLLSQLAACTEGPDSAAVDSRTRKRLCTSLDRAMNRYKKRWLERALPRLAEIVPSDIPTTVVYPFGGGDLLTALATFPKFTEITTMSLELPGDVRAIKKYQKGKLGTHLENSHRHMRHLFQVAHSKTSNMRKIMRSDLPGQIIFGLVAMRVHDHEALSLRYFSLKPDGSIEYKSMEQIESELSAAKTKKERAAVFSMMEIEFRKKGGGPIRVWRHIGANLDNKHLEGSPILAHLKAKGKITAITKAASYLLWWQGFATIRNYLLDNMVWMISDSTGIPPSKATPRGFEQITYGKFNGPFLNAGNGPTKEFRKLYRAQPHRKITFRFGYPDNSKQSHLIVTRLKK